MWHDLLHSVAAATLVLTGIPFLYLAWRAYRRRPRRSPLTAAGGALPAVFAVTTAMCACGAVFIASLATRAAPVDAAALTLIAASLGAMSLHAGHRARFDGVVTIPLIGLIGIAALLAIAGPQRTIDHHTHEASAIVR
jgi:hypothetical protein